MTVITQLYNSTVPCSGTNITWR